MRAEMDLFTVVQLADPKAVTVGVRPLREGEAPILEATVGRVMELALEDEALDEGSQVPIEATPINVADPTTQSSDAEESESSESVEVVSVVDAPPQIEVDLKHKGPMVEDDGATSLRRKRRVVRTSESSSEHANGSGMRAAGTGAHVTGGKGASPAVPEEDIVKSPPNVSS